MKPFFLILIGLFLSLESKAQKGDSITIKFKNLELLENGWKGKTFYFKLNNKVFTPSATPVRLAISTAYEKWGISADLFYLSFDSLFTDEEGARASFIKDSTYIISINPCSQYELYPEHGAHLGKLRMTVVNTGHDTIYASANDGLLLETITKGYVAADMPIEVSAMCPYGRTKVEYYIEEITGERKTLKTFYIHYLHGEVYATFYDRPDGFSFVAFNGYTK